MSDQSRVRALGGPWPIPEPAGELTQERLRRMFDGIWNARRPVIPWGHRDLLADLPPKPVGLRCGAVLFAPDESLKNAIRWERITRDVAVSPVEAAWLNSPDQGPAPLRCALPEHPAGSWHWDGQGTWWKP